MFEFMITHFAVGMPVETFKSKKKSVYFFEVHNFEDKRSLVDIDQLPNISFRFFIKWAQLFLSDPSPIIVYPCH